MATVNAPTPAKSHAPLPSPVLLSMIFDVENGEVVWSATREPAACSDLGNTGRFVIMSFYCLEHDALRHALETGEWPEGLTHDWAPDIHREAFARANHRFLANNRQLEKRALLEAA